MELSNIFSNNMVFAANKPIIIFGNGKGNAKIIFNNTIKQIESNEEFWSVEFPKMSYGGPYELSVEFEDKKILLTDIYVGEVYLIAGQSNLQFKLKDSSTKIDKYENNDKLRLFSTDKLEEGESFFPKDGWIKSKKEYVGNWSAIGYLVGNEISKNKKIAVGIVACYQGASTIETWLPKGTCEKLGIFIDDKDKYVDHYYEEFKIWNQDGKLYDYQLGQVKPFSLSGVIWYQGESDAYGEESKVYLMELKELIKIWRNDFNDINLPFIVIQIADFDGRNNDAWKSIQKAQLDIQNEMNNVTSIISKDVCESDDIHPKSKEKLSQRIVKGISSYSV